MSYQETRILTQSGDKLTVYEESDFDRMNEKREQEGEEPLPALKVQTFLFNEVSEESPLEEFSAYVPDPKKQAAIINRGLVLCQQQYSLRLLQDKDFTPVEGAYDLKVAFDAIGKRKAATRRDISAILAGKDPSELAEILSNLPKEKLEQLFALMS